MIYFIGHKGAHTVSENVSRFIQAEQEKGLDRKETYVAFAERVAQLRVDILELLTTLKAEGKRVAAYGAPAKGNTLLNYCGITTDLIEYTVDKSPYKQNFLTPGAHLPVYHPDGLLQDMPDYVFILAWNFADEISGAAGGVSGQRGEIHHPDPSGDHPVIFTETSLAGAYIIDVQRIEDERGFFGRSFCRDEFATHGLKAEVAQCNISFNRLRGTVRGMHFQRHPRAEAKLVRCTQGAIHDIIIDLRPDSATFCHWVEVVLSTGNHRMLYIPEGFAHGFQTLVDDT